MKKRRRKINKRTRSKKSVEGDGPDGRDHDAIFFEKITKMMMIVHFVRVVVTFLLPQCPFFMALSLSRRRAGESPHLKFMNGRAGDWFPQLRSCSAFTAVHWAPFERLIVQHEAKRKIFSMKESDKLHLWYTQSTLKLIERSWFFFKERYPPSVESLGSPWKKKREVPVCLYARDC